ncbi:MAG: UDP-N-acetylmuramoyl-L-alanine--D-glutamate ligase [Candidatus Thiodiazotropha sp. (ex Lucinoma aequizonata)]|nr:UDP-N-acetylmuramoyl-L-alanine--D-glutamate ligase [Candidatus Thiodiazotropha sp. (ex Lucinoma aequizonata)]MCU7889539.1 UDP-N-acetylmuramoyl-L-alanine--D-glutamate ligase [Candidatus Thiodiazotropha sp. (ex Lucinoma aequizonata)]MCU7894504.1 UDP-N-acetylmuramoyl-L-alanine--D-glutamate ligase [Candidatus Thiodiazotropha sp. (ex Lucinoma aequizonata)]MCU7898873.1 UDP-N-acetylmuramoyl-L-alanine--D-glutamate ligase [Candidatus Thiodiazotropha sp. (ex Lucinoma aequizonata)]MCU7900612.1 UDP-N-ac
MTQQETKPGKTLIVGLGVTGLSCVRHLAPQGVSLAVTDSRESPPGLEALRKEFPDMALFLGGFQPEAFQAASQLVVSPGIALDEPLIQAAREQGIEIVGDVELFARAVRAPVVAITGSNGKSTVTTLLGEMARMAGVRVAIGGNLGEPALALLDEAVELYVLELSSFQLESTWSLTPTAAVVLNISPDHMDRYRDVDAYVSTKAMLYDGTEVTVINRDDPRVAGMANQQATTVGFTLKTPSGSDFGLHERDGVSWLSEGHTPLMPVSELRILGRHNVANALAALALGSAVWLPQNDMLAALRSYSGLPHRTQWITDKRGLRWYDDSKGTNVGATVAALEGLHPDSGASRSILIAGGECKNADFSALAPVVEGTARVVILIGRDASLIESALIGHCPLMHATSLTEAVQQAVEFAQPGDRVLLSPACASFDMFKDFETRGEAFIQAVEALSA